MRSWSVFVENLGGAFSTWVERERDRLFLWTPVALAVGIGIYFSLPVEPPTWMAVVPILIIGSISWILRHRAMAVIPLILLFTTSVGFVAAQWRTMEVQSVVIEHRLGPTRVEAQIEKLERREKDIRLTLTRPRIRGLPAYKTPMRVRLVLKGRQPELQLGDWVDVLAVVTPPLPPTAPGDFDFQRMAFFMELGGTGFALGQVRILSHARQGDEQSLSRWIDQARLTASTRIRQILPGDTGAVVDALMTGQRGGISAAAMENIRDAGLAHLLAISGLHLGLLASTLFFGVRLLLALIPAISLRHDIKKWAAVLALVGTFAYTLFSGASVPTQRAFLMTGLIMIAVLLDREPISMRLVAVAATLILLLRPESLLGASFQMSFAAVVALVALFEYLRIKDLHTRLRGFSYGAVLSYPATVMGVTLVAGLATAPLTLFHFHQLPVFGVVGNLLAVPVVAMWVMPLAVLAFILMPLGMEIVALVPMGWGIEWMLLVALEIASWDSALIWAPAVPVWGVVCMAVGGIWLCLIQGRSRLLGIVGFVLFLVATMSGRPPDLIVDQSGRLLAARTQEGRLLFSSLRRGTLSRKSWIARAGNPDYGRWPQPGIGPVTLNQRGTNRLACDRLGCVLHFAGETVAVVADHLALIEDCRMSTILIAPMAVSIHCPSPGIIVDGRSLRRYGAHAFWFEGGQVIVKTVNGERGRRPWVPTLQ